MGTGVSYVLTLIRLCYSKREAGNPSEGSLPGRFVDPWLFAGLVSISKVTYIIGSTLAPQKSDGYGVTQGLAAPSTL